MRLDRMLQALLPHDEMFFTYYDSLAKTIVEAADELRKLPSLAKTEREPVVKKIEQFEEKGDSITHEIFNELNRTFVTPFDREDIHELASAMDDVLDYIDGSAKRFHLYKIKKNYADIQRLTEVVYLSVIEMQRGVSLINNFKHVEEFKKILHQINQYENDADMIFDQAIADLFDNEANPIELIKTKEVLVSLETATDKCEDVANVLETLLIKHA
ncbi:MAG: DUF47 family protein [Bacteroidota bacterium]|nr:DUF47 family protein [Bacteroidota bacterium]